MNFSYPFIMRPVGTTLLAIGLMLVGIIAYRFLPVASLPGVELPTIRVSASRPGADPAIMAATVAAPLERQLGVIARLDLGHRAVRSDAQHRRRRARRAGCDLRLAGRPAERPALDTLVP